MGSSKGNRQSPDILQQRECHQPCHIDPPAQPTIAVLGITRWSLPRQQLQLKGVAQVLKGTCLWWWMTTRRGGGRFEWHLRASLPLAIVSSSVALTSPLEAECPLSLSPSLSHYLAHAGSSREAPEKENRFLTNSAKGGKLSALESCHPLSMIEATTTLAVAVITH